MFVSELVIIARRAISESETKDFPVTLSTFNPNAVCVADEMGLFASEVLSTLFKPRLTFAPAAVAAPVPPLAIATTPVTFSAVLVANA